MWKSVAGGSLEDLASERFELAQQLPQVIPVGASMWARPVTDLPQMLALGREAGNCVANWDTALSYLRDGHVLFRVEDAQGRVHGYAGGECGGAGAAE